MKLFFKTLKTLLFSVALFATIAVQAMEQQQEKCEYNFLVEALDEAMRNNNAIVCAELFKSFSEDLAAKEIIEQTAVIVQLIQEATPKNAELTVVFCNVLVDIFKRTTQDLTPIVQEIITPIVNVLIEANNIKALERIVCIFADNKESIECVNITNAIKENTSKQHISANTDQDEAIAKSLQGTPNVTIEDNDEALNIALAISASEFDNPNAPTLEELRELDEENELSIALEESFQNQTNNTTTSNTSTISKIFNILLGGFGS